MEKANKHEPKKTGDRSKIKTSAKKGGKGKVTHSGFDFDVASAPAAKIFDLPPTDRFREEARIQIEV